jgi:hypothetical protein
MIWRKSAVSSYKFNRTLSITMKFIFRVFVALTLVCAQTSIALAGPMAPGSLTITQDKVKRVTQGYTITDSAGNSWHCDEPLLTLIVREDKCSQTIRAPAKNALAAAGNKHRNRNPNKTIPAKINQQGPTHRGPTPVTPAAPSPAPLSEIAPQSAQSTPVASVTADPPPPTFDVMPDTWGGVNITAAFANSAELVLRCDDSRVATQAQACDKNNNFAVNSFALQLGRATMQNASDVEKSTNTIMKEGSAEATSGAASLKAGQMECQVAATACHEDCAKAPNAIQTDQKQCASACLNEANVRQAQIVKNHSANPALKELLMQVEKANINCQETCSVIAQDLMKITNESQKKCKESNVAFLALAGLGIAGFLAMLKQTKDGEAKTANTSPETPAKPADPVTPTTPTTPTTPDTTPTTTTPEVDNPPIIPIDTPVVECTANDIRCQCSKANANNPRCACLGSDGRVDQACMCAKYPNDIVIKGEFRCSEGGGKQRPTLNSGVSSALNKYMPTSAPTTAQASERAQIAPAAGPSPFALVNDAYRKIAPEMKP